jgi:hypothetical protein
MDYKIVGFVGPLDEPYLICERTTHHALTNPPAWINVPFALIPLDQPRELPALDDALRTRLLARRGRKETGLLAKETDRL